MLIAGIALGAATATVMHQAREGGVALARSRAESQARAALALVPSALAGLSPAAGDLVAGEARDTALQLRVAMAQGVACDSTTGIVMLSVADSGTDHSTALASAPKAGDSLWWWPPGGASWNVRRVTSVSSGTATCAADGPGTRPVLRIGFGTPDTVPARAPVRVTRQARYSFYRAGDGTWQLGLAEWSDVLHAFAPPQPVAGPFLLAAGTRSGFRYFDAAAAELSTSGQGAEANQVVRIRVTVVTSAGPTGTTPGTYRDSVDIAFGHAL
jgi:hypothetical protein